MYIVMDESSKFIYLRSNSLKEATLKAREMYFSALKEHGLIEYFKVYNTKLGTLAFVTGL